MWGKPLIMVITIIVATAALIFTSIDYAQSTSLLFCGIGQRTGAAANNDGHHHHDTIFTRLHTNEWLYDATFTLRPPGQSNRRCSHRQSIVLLIMVSVVVKIVVRTTATMIMVMSTGRASPDCLELGILRLKVASLWNEDNNADLLRIEFAKYVIAWYSPLVAHLS
jgi:hypothetical protein